jgi:G3E family GTPase
LRIIILGGFLGSGKTTVLLQFARYLVNMEQATKNQIKVAIIENEVGEVGVDDKVIANEGFSVNNLFSGCACCSLSGDLIYSIRNIEENLGPEWLIIEATGIAHPGSIKDIISKRLEVTPYILTVADAKRWKRLARAMETFVSGQLEESSKVLLNKADLVTDDELEEVKRSIQGYNSGVEIIATSAKDALPDNLWKKVADEVKGLYGVN